MRTRTAILMLNLYKRLLAESRKFIEVMNRGGSSKDLRLIQIERQSIDDQFERLKKKRPE